MGHAVQRAGRSTAAFTKLNERYPRLFAYALVISLIAHALYMFLGSGPASRPYQLRENPIQVIDIPDPIYVPPPPPEVVRPEIPAPAEEPVPIEAPEEPLPPTTFNPLQPPVSRPPPALAEVFYAFTQRPVVIEPVEPEYPELALETYSQGTVHVQVNVDETGRVIRAVILKSDAVSILEEAALEAARKTRFRPAKQRDVPVKATVVLPYVFRIKPN
jgi:protein TonB